MLPGPVCTVLRGYAVGIEELGLITIQILLCNRIIHMY